jgi:hypothetical protein
VNIRQCNSIVIVNLLNLLFVSDAGAIGSPNPRSKIPFFRYETFPRSMRRVPLLYAAKVASTFFLSPSLTALRKTITVSENARTETQ